MPCNLDDFVVGEPLGEGSFGTVSRCTLNGVPYAMKAIVKASVEKQKHGAKQVMTEKQALLRLADPRPHPSIVQLHFTFRDDEHLYFVLELASGGELSETIDRLGSLHIESAQWLTAELVSALAFMHSRHVVHRDLKPQNILLAESNHIKLVDFGSARLLDSDDEHLAFVGTAEYVSPEVVHGEAACEASDYWAAGCILFCMLVGTPPFRGESEYLIFERIKVREFAQPEVLGAIPADARAFLEALLEISAADRLGGGTDGPEAVRAHRFFTASRPPINFDSLTSLPPPPLTGTQSPPLPMPPSPPMPMPPLTAPAAPAVPQALVKVPVADRRSGTAWMAKLGAVLGRIRTEGGHLARARSWAARSTQQEAGGMGSSQDGSGSRARQRQPPILLRSSSN